VKLIQIKNEKISFSGISFNLILNDKTNLEIKTHLIGKFNVDNLTFAITTILGLGLQLPDLQEDTSYIKGASGRMEVVPLPNGAIGLIDYAHTPDALKKALLTLVEIRNNDLENNKNDCKIICIFGCGGDRDKAKRPEMGRIASELADIVLLTSDNPRSENPAKIIDEILVGISSELHDKVSIIPNRKEAIQKAYIFSHSSDILLIAGKGHEDYQIIGSEKTHFDDKEELINFISKKA
jgi:UDP-N-acetylmuramoyl-L-alanyl-D-glutamate--2,6-diaminopimelate ligase